MPSEKSPQMDAFLTGVTGISRRDANAAGICVTCRKEVGPFRNQISKREYNISGMCQACQDSVFGEDPADDVFDPTLD